MMKRLLTISIFFLHAPVFAHPGHGANLVAGLWHPVSGADHLLTMLALGLWAFQMGGRARWIIPASFTVFMFAGSALALTGIKLPYPEHAILASLVISGILLAAGAKLPMLIAALITGLFAIFHGYAHGIEALAPSPAYFLGFLTTSLILLFAGVALGNLFKKTPIIIRLAGAVIVGYAGFL